MACSSESKLVGDAALPDARRMIDFWQWAFGDLCDDDIKGIFAEWMVGTLIGLPMTSSRRVSWANSDLITGNGLRIEVKATAYWQSWKLVNEDGSRKASPPPLNVNPSKVRFSGLQARTSLTPAGQKDSRHFKSDVYVFCLQTQTDPANWDALQLANWEFYVLTKGELSSLGIGNSISLSTLRRSHPALTAGGLQDRIRPLLE
jgi:hypothetical protein